MPKSKKTLEASLDLTPSFMTSVDERVEGLVSNLDYFENRRRNFIRKKYGRKTCLQHLRPALTRSVLQGSGTSLKFFILDRWPR